MKNYELIDKSEVLQCRKCEGKGCIECNKTGQFRDSYYMIIDNKNKIAIDSDTGG